MKRAARSVVPYSAVRETGANVPALKHFFRCLETSGTVMTDSKGGCVWDLSAGGYSLLFDRAGSVGTVAPTMTRLNNPLPLASGVFHTFDSAKASLVLSVVRSLTPYGFEDATTTGQDDYRPKTSIGDINGLTGLYSTKVGIGLSNEDTVHAVWGTSPSTMEKVAAPSSGSTTLPVYSNAYCDLVGFLHGTRITRMAGYYYGQDTNLIGKYNPASAASFNTYDTDGANLQLFCEVESSSTLRGSGTTYTPNPCMWFHNVAVYGYAIFEFENGFPADIDLACIWMAQEWKRGNRVIWPGWIGLA